MKICQNNADTCPCFDDHRVLYLSTAEEQKHGRFKFLRVLILLIKGAVKKALERLKTNCDSKKSQHTVCQAALEERSCIRNTYMS